MTQAADAAWRATARQAWSDLQPFPGRLGMTWRVALLCAIVAGVAMLLKIPESAISCYLIIFLMRPDSAAVSAQAIGLIVLASIVVVAIAPVIQATADSPMLRISVIAGISFVFVYLGSASQLGEIGSIIALVIVFILTLVDDVPANGIVTHGLFYAWKMAVMPMTLMIVFNLMLGTGPHHLLRQTVAQRLSAAADVLERPDAEASLRLRELLAQGNAEAGQQVLLTRVFHTASKRCADWLSGAVTTSYALLLAVQALPGTIAADTEALLSRRCREAAQAVAAGGRPEGEFATLQPGGDKSLPAAAAIESALDGLALPNGGTDAKPSKAPFFAADALTNPDHQRYALKTTAAAILCYIIYSLTDWQGIHTALVTCYVVALGTTGETVHKLGLRIVGCLVGAALGIASILFVIPHLTSVGGLMVLVFCGIMVGAWVSTGSERIAYGGVQIGLAFLLTILNGFAPSLDMSAARDRIAGILLGNLIIYLIFTGIWSKTIMADVTERLVNSLAAVGQIARLPSATRPTAAQALAEQVEDDMGKADDELALVIFEPERQRPSVEMLARTKDLVAEVRGLASALLFAPQVSDDMEGRLSNVAQSLARDHGPAPRESGERMAASTGDDDQASDTIEQRMRRIEQLASG